jgi:PPOX class probable F420-dependent enzyme
VRRDLPLEQLGDLLERPLNATLATFRQDGSVLLSPVWHEWRDGGFHLSTSADDVKIRQIRRDPRASIVVYENEPPYRGVEVRGVPVVVPDEGYRVLRRIATRYLGETAGNAFADVATWESVVIRLEPGRLRTWDFADAPLFGGSEKS